MPGPSIPNLLSLRGSRGGRGGPRGRGRGQSGRGAPLPDAAVQGTDTDAAVSRMSAVDLEYLHDPYAIYFVSRADGPPTRRLPIINRGTYARTTALDRLIEAFLSTRPGLGGGPNLKQIISLGAGTDTRPFRIFAQGQHDGLVYHELDFAVTSNKKAHTVRSSPALSKILTNISTDEHGSWSGSPATGGQYYCHGVDLRELTTQEEKPLPGLRNDIPTLLLSECCLCYLKEEESERVLKYFGSPTANLAVVLYEPMHLDDAFGNTMVLNLAARGIRMPGLEKFRNSNDQVQRLRDNGFSTVKFMTIDNVWDSWVDSEEKERVDGLEGLDEVEEWKLLAGHYIVSWAFKGTGFESISTIEGKN